MEVGCIERIVAGIVVGTAVPATQSASKGKYRVRAAGARREWTINNLDHVALFLKLNPGASVRMSPGWRRIVRNIHIDGVPLRGAHQSVESTRKCKEAAA